MKIPSWALDACLDDDTFAAAYESVPAEMRALLKTAIARQYVWQAPTQCSSSQRTRRWTQGFESLELLAPADNCLLLIDGACSPAELIAALLPALNAGVGSVLVAHARTAQADSVSAGMLAALELAGQETVAALPPGNISELLKELTTQEESCIVLALGGTAELVPHGFADGARRRVWIAPEPGNISVVRDGAGADVDLEALAFAHPSARFVVAGPGTPLPDERFTQAGAGLDDLSAAGGLVCFAPDALADEALERFPLVFGPGHEACWLLPDLGIDFFQVRRIAWRSIADCETEEE